MASPDLFPAAPAVAKKKKKPHRRPVSAYDEAQKIGDIIQKHGEKMTLEQFSEFLQEIGDMVRKMDECLDPEDFK